MTKQELFQKSITHLLSQNKQSLVFKNNKWLAAYRSRVTPPDELLIANDSDMAVKDSYEDELSCAIGCLIPNEAYQSKFEGISINVDLYSGPCYFSNNPKFAEITKEIKASAGIDEFNLELAIDLQRLHDHNEPETWKELSTRLGQRYNLNTTFIDNA